MIELQTLVQLLSQYVTHPDPDGPNELAVIFKPFDKEGRGVMTIQVGHGVFRSLRGGYSILESYRRGKC